jgi:hypothetical protein
MMNIQLVEEVVYHNTVLKPRKNLVRADSERAEALIPYYAREQKRFPDTSWWARSEL